jgi:hypothetical protein
MTYTCRYCKVFHPKVEAGGMWYCPNPACRGCGAAWFKRTLDSYEDQPYNEYSFDEDECDRKAVEYIKENNLKFTFKDFKMELEKSKEQFESELDQVIEEKIRAKNSLCNEAEQKWKKYFDMKKILIEKWVK